MSTYYDLGKGYKIGIPHFYCLEYCEGDKKMFVEMDFRESFSILDPILITHWEKPYECIEIDISEKKRILQNIREFLLIEMPSRSIIMENM